MTLALIIFCRYLTWLWPLSEFSWSQRIRWPRGCYSSTSFSSNDEVFVFCLFLFTNFWWVFKPYQKLHWYTTKGLSFSVQISNVLEGDQMVSTWPRFSGLEWRLHRCSLHAFWKVYFFMKKKILLFMIENTGTRNHIE